MKGSRKDKEMKKEDKQYGTTTTTATSTTGIKIDKSKKNSTPSFVLFQHK